MSPPSPYPTVGDYLHWARTIGCAVVCAPEPDQAGLDYIVGRITQPDGRSVCQVFVDERDTLMSTEVARLDRRLGLKSYFFV